MESIKEDNNSSVNKKPIKPLKHSSLLEMPIGSSLIENNNLLLSENSLVISNIISNDTDINKLNSATTTSNMSCDNTTGMSSLPIRVEPMYQDMILKKCPDLINNKQFSKNREYDQTQINDELTIEDIQSPVTKRSTIEDGLEKNSIPPVIVKPTIKEKSQNKPNPMIRKPTINEKSEKTPSFGIEKSASKEKSTNNEKSTTNEKLTTKEKSTVTEKSAADEKSPTKEKSTVKEKSTIKEKSTTDEKSTTNEKSKTNEKSENKQSPVNKSPTDKKGPQKKKLSEIEKPTTKETSEIKQPPVIGKPIDKEGPQNQQLSENEKPTTKDKSNNKLPPDTKQSSDEKNSKTPSPVIDIPNTEDKSVYKQISTVGKSIDKEKSMDKEKPIDKDKPIDKYKPVDIEKTQNKQISDIQKSTNIENPDNKFPPVIGISTGNENIKIDTQNTDTPSLANERPTDKGNLDKKLKGTVIQKPTIGDNIQTGRSFVENTSGEMILTEPTVYRRNCLWLTPKPASAFEDNFTTIPKPKVMKKL